jgi:hypothetical protein
MWDTIELKYKDNNIQIKQTTGLGSRPCNFILVSTFGIIYKIRFP